MVPSYTQHDTRGLQDVQKLLLAALPAPCLMAAQAQLLQSLLFVFSPLQQGDTPKRSSPAPALACS